MNHEEKQYLDLMERIVRHGVRKDDRTGVGTHSLFGEMMKFDLSDHTLPLFTTKKVFWKGVIEELCWFMQGQTDSKILEEKGVNIWKGNTSREFLDKNELPYDEGMAGPIYGWQWRNFGGDYNTEDGRVERNQNKWRRVDELGVDQLTQIASDLCTDPHSRRHILTAWNPNQLFMMALPPCHVMAQFWVDNDRGLHCSMYQRSCDMFLGVPFNVASYATLTHIMAKICNMKARSFTWMGGDCHVYSNHFDQVREQASRTPKAFPKLLIREDMIFDFDNIQPHDFKIKDYNPHPAIKADMAV